MLFCDPSKTKECPERLTEQWDELYGRLRGRATLALVDLQTARVTQKRFSVKFNNLPDIIYISRGHFYRFKVMKDKTDKISPIIDLDELERFVNNREYEDIPDVFPEDYGKIAGVPSMFDGAFEVLQSEINNKGGLMNFLMFKDEDGDINWKAFGSIYSGLGITLYTIYMMIKDALPSKPEKSS